jgi:hypothetical protein
MHVRRGDFSLQFNAVTMTGEQVLNNTLGILKPNTTVFVATDEKDLTYFNPLARRYRLLFLKDFREALSTVNPNYYGMIDQLVASRGDTFFGAYLSTFSGYSE